MHHSQKHIEPLATVDHPEKAGWTPIKNSIGMSRLMASHKQQENMKRFVTHITRLSWGSKEDPKIA